MKKYPNEHFYTAGGEFDAETAKKAYYELMEFYHYPIPPRLRGDDFWTVDFGLGIFTEVGMAGILWLNQLEGGYFGHEIFLLPGQMIPEHNHVETADAPAKMEGWVVRHGWVHAYGEGEGEPTPGIEIPPSHKDCLVAKTQTKLLPGEVGHLDSPGEMHWLRAGPEGAIVTEHASYHDGAGMRFSCPGIQF